MCRSPTPAVSLFPCCRRLYWLLAHDWDRQRGAYACIALEIGVQHAIDAGLAACEPRRVDGKPRSPWQRIDRVALEGYDRLLPLGCSCGIVRMIGAEQPHARGRVECPAADPVRETTSHGPRWRSRTFSSTRRRRRSPTTRTSTPLAHASTWASLCRHVCEGSDAAGQRLLVADHGQRRTFLRTE